LVGKNASNGNSGLTPQEPFSTIQNGLDKCVAERGDTVVVLPGSVTITAAITMTKADVTLTGAVVTGPQTRNPSVIVCATDSVEMIAIDAADVTVENLTLDHNTTTANNYLIDIGDATASPRCILRNLFLDMEGSATNTGGVSVSSDTVSVSGLIEGCRIHDVDASGIVIFSGNDEWVIRGCLIYDQVTANITASGIYTVSDGSTIENCVVRTAGSHCIRVDVGFLVTIKDCTLAAHGADTIGILANALSTLFVDNCFIHAAAAGNVVDFQTSATVPSSVIAWEGIQNTNPTIGVLTTATVDGT